MGRFGTTLKYGCFGCVGIGLALMLIVGVLVGIAAWQSGGPTAVEQRELTQELPSTPGDGYGGERDRLPRIELDGGAPPSGVGRVVLRMRIGSFRVVPGPPGTPVRVDAEYDTNRYKLTQSYEPAADGSWSYTVKFGPRSLLSFLTIGDSGDPEVTVTLPRDVPMVIDADIGMGESQVDLGGLTVLDARFALGMGDHVVDFSEPLPLPMASLLIDGGMGALGVRRVGNASPARVDVKHSMGEMRLDLRGAWVRDADVTARCSMGECAVGTPDDVGLELLGSRILLGESNIGAADRPRPAADAALLRIDVRHSMGELTLD